MGLAASQARLLTITSRKSDCEFQSMRLSHEKLSISRDLALLSNEYQNSIDQTKLMYDFYGDTSNREQLNYNILMTPSAMNNYIPITITNSSNRVVLDNKFAKAARAAGIPQEGLGCTPSSSVRDMFVKALLNNKIIDEGRYKSIMQVPYDPEASVGGAVSGIKEIPPTNGTLTDLTTALASYQFTFDDLNGNKLGSNTSVKKNGNEVNSTLTLADILTGNVTITGSNWDNDDLNGDGQPRDTDIFNRMANAAYWTQLYKAIDSVLYTEGKSGAALNYAKSKIEEMLEIHIKPGGNQDTHNLDSANLSDYTTKKKKKQKKGTGWVNDRIDNSIGYLIYANSGGSYNDSFGLNLTNVTKAFFSYYAEMMTGFKGTYDIKKHVTESRLVDSEFDGFLFPSQVDLSDEQSKYAVFYDTLLNQIATCGWTENAEITDNSYLQEMLQNGMMYISTVSDDNYYYQRNYGTWNYVREVTDDTAVAQAEARYKTEKEKLNSKEQRLDLKMKNLDTEMSAITTEYDTVKNLISKSIEKSFKRYNA